MDNYLLNVTNVYRVPTEEDALKLREELADISYGVLKSFAYKLKETKDDEYIVCTAKIEFTPEKAPDIRMTAVYKEDI